MSEGTTAEDTLPSGALHLCQVPGCTVDFRYLRGYHQRYHICDTHQKADFIVKDGMKQRFCQQCGHYHALDAFEKNKRSCRASLNKHNERRRRNRIKAVKAELHEEKSDEDLWTSDDEPVEPVRKTSSGRLVIPSLRLRSQSTLKRCNSGDLSEGICGSDTPTKRQTTLQPPDRAQSAGPKELAAENNIAVKSEEELAINSQIARLQVQRTNSRTRSMSFPDPHQPDTHVLYSQSGPVHSFPAARHYDGCTDMERRVVAGGLSVWQHNEFEELLQHKNLQSLRRQHLMAELLLIQRQQHERQQFQRQRLLVEALHRPELWQGSQPHSAAAHNRLDEPNIATTHSNNQDRSTKVEAKTPTSTIKGIQQVASAETIEFRHMAETLPATTVDALNAAHCTSQEPVYHNFPGYHHASMRTSGMHEYLQPQVHLSNPVESQVHNFQDLEGRWDLPGPSHKQQLHRRSQSQYNFSAVATQRNRFTPESRWSMDEGQHVDLLDGLLANEVNDPLLNQLMLTADF